MSLLRKYIKELLKEQNVLAAGMCFPFAAKKAEEWFDQHFEARRGRAPKRHPDLNNMDKFKVVHGKVTDQWKKPPKPIVHAWVEMGDLVFDDQTKMTKPDGIPKDVYYDMYQPEVVKEYNAEEVVVNCIMKGEGPWDEGLVGIMKQRDAWMKESQLRDYINSLLAEDLGRRQALAKDLESSEGWPMKTGDKHRRSQFDADSQFASGRELKKAFHKHADRAFLNTLTTVHWVDHGYPNALKKILRGSSKDEVSASAYLPGELANTGTGAVGSIGLEIKGHISLLANNMDWIITGGLRDFKDVDPQRTASSGRNKGVKKTYIPSGYARDNAIVVLDKADWNPVGADDGITNNEALVDNWRPVAIVTSNEQDYDEDAWLYIEKMSKEHDLEIKSTKGMY